MVCSMENDSVKLGITQLLFIVAATAITVLTFLGIYHESGSTRTLSYAKGLLCLNVPWLAYVTCVILLMPKRGIIPALKPVREIVTAQ